MFPKSRKQGEIVVYYISIHHDAAHRLNKHGRIPKYLIETWVENSVRSHRENIVSLPWGAFRFGSLFNIDPGAYFTRVKTMERIQWWQKCQPIKYNQVAFDIPVPRVVHCRWDYFWRKVNSTFGKSLESAKLMRWIIATFRIMDVWGLISPQKDKSGFFWGFHRMRVAHMGHKENHSQTNRTVWKFCVTMAT